MIYLDTCILIYATEYPDARGGRVRAALADVDDHAIAVSPLVEMECLVKPLAESNPRLADAYRTVLERCRILDPDRGVYRRAAELRAMFGIRAVDAIHLALAQLSGCEALWTNDERLAKASGGLAVNMLA